VVSPERIPRTLPRILTALLTPRAYSHPVDAITLLETPISWVLLAGAFAYKIKRPVQYAFIDMRSLERRRFLCHEELRLNRRFAPMLYLDVVGITLSGGEARMGGEGTAIEYAVRMYRFDQDQQLDRLLERNAIEPPELEVFGRRLAGLHAQAPVARDQQPWGSAAQVKQIVMRNWRETLQAVQGVGAHDSVQAMQAPLLTKLDFSEPWLSARRLAGCVRECHGDLHTRNIARIDGQLVAFDCAEFEPSFRWIDVADESALLVVDLESRGRAAHAHAFWSAWLEQSGDYGAHRVLPLYKVHRALVRAKVAALSHAAANDGPERESLRAEYCRLIEHAERAFLIRSGPLVLMCGLSGSGKTWLARQLATSLGLIHVRSDVERKRLAGLEPDAQSGSGLGRGLYAPSMTESVYGRLLACAEDVLCSGGALIDATFARRLDRARFASMARRLRVPATIIYCHAPELTLRSRVGERRRSGHDASEADQQVLDWQLQAFEPLKADEELPVIDADTGSVDVVARTREAVRRLLDARTSVP